jgi:hypothetical protein
LREARKRGTEPAIMRLFSELVEIKKTFRKGVEVKYIGETSLFMQAEHFTISIIQ